MIKWICLIGILVTACSSKPILVKKCQPVAGDGEMSACQRL